MQTVLTGIPSSRVRLDPFPHLVVENCLPPALYRALADNYPGDATVAGASLAQQNLRRDISARQVLAPDSTVAPLWQDFVRRHTAPAFWAEVTEVFGDAIRHSHPELETRLGAPLGQLATGVRFDPASDTGAISLDCQIGINTAVQRKSSVRGVHTDAPEELFAMLLYFRREEDDSTGGDLEIHRWKPGRPRRFVGTEIDAADADLVATVPYRANTLVAFINGEDALHAVSPRSVTPHSRRLVNIIGEVYRPLPQGLFVKRQKPFARLRMKARRWRGER